MVMVLHSQKKKSDDGVGVNNEWPQLQWTSTTWVDYVVTANENSKESRKMVFYTLHS
jgi:hypothetical protein